MIPQKVVTPAATGVQCACNCLEILDRNLAPLAYLRLEFRGRYEITITALTISLRLLMPITIFHNVTVAVSTAIFEQRLILRMGGGMTAGYIFCLFARLSGLTFRINSPERE